jgi:hypothetical protein
MGFDRILLDLQFYELRSTIRNYFKGQIMLSKSLNRTS